MNGDVFRGLNNLQTVYLHSNPCIDADFDNEAAIEKLPQIAAEKCGFCEKLADMTNCEILREFKLIQAKILRAVIEKQNSKVETARLEERLNGCTANQKTHEKLEAQMEATYAAKTENFENLLETKLRENEKMSSEIGALRTELHEKKIEIKTLKFKLEQLQDNFQ